jgi:hypothetical protein
MTFHGGPTERSLRNALASARRPVEIESADLRLAPQS